MKKILVLLAALFVCAAVYVPCRAQYISGYADLSDSDVTKTLKNHISYLASDALEGRKAGSEGEYAAAEYVRDMFKEYGIDLLSGSEGDVFGISMPAGDTLTSRNVVGFVQGYDHTKFDRYIVVGARMDNLGVNVVDVDGKPVRQIYNGANGNASGVAMMLELARMVKTQEIMFRRSVIFIAFGASEQSFAGSWYFLNRSFSDYGKIDAMIDLDALGTGSGGFYAYTSSNADMNMIVSQVSSDLQPITPEVTAEEPFASDHRSFYSKKIPSVLFTTGRYPEHNTLKDTESIIEYEQMERELEYIYNFTRFLCNTENPPRFEQSDVTIKVNDKLYNFADCDRRPAFMGSTDPKSFLTRWVYQYLKYPKAALDNGVQGRVVVEFTIGKDGKLYDVHVVRSASEALDDEALRVIKASPKWKPAQVKGVNVNSVMSVAVDFRLTKKGKFAIKK